MNVLHILSSVQKTITLVLTSSAKEVQSMGFKQMVRKHVYIFQLHYTSLVLIVFTMED